MAKGTSATRIGVFLLVIVVLRDGATLDKAGNGIGS